MIVFNDINKKYRNGIHCIIYKNNEGVESSWLFANMEYDKAVERFKRENPNFEICINSIGNYEIYRCML